MKTNSITKTVLCVAGALFTAALAQADSYSWTNLQSDIAGAGQHVDSNLINSWVNATTTRDPVMVSSMFSIPEET
jgi:hypothetical protein